MSDYFDEFDDFDDEALTQLEAIEATQNSSPKTRKAPLSRASSFDDLSSFDFDETDLQRLDEFVQGSIQGTLKPPPPPPCLVKKTTYHQKTLFGDVIPNQASSSSSRPPMQRVKSTPKNPFGQQAPKTKKWDHTQFAKSGLKASKAAKGKGKAREEDFEDEVVEFEQFPAPFVSRE